MAAAVACSPALQRPGAPRAAAAGRQQPCRLQLPVLSSPRRACACRAAAEEGRDARPLFSASSGTRQPALDMADIMDAHEVCSLIPDPNERHQCYSVFGLDAQRMNSYFDVVLSLEHQLAADLSDAVVVSWPGRDDDPDDYLHAPAECSLSE